MVSNHSINKSYMKYGILKTNKYLVANFLNLDNFLRIISIFFGRIYKIFIILFKKLNKIIYVLIFLITKKYFYYNFYE